MNQLQLFETKIEKYLKSSSINEDDIFSLVTNKFCENEPTYKTFSSHLFKLLKEFDPLKSSSLLDSLLTWSKYLKENFHINENSINYSEFRNKILKEIDYYHRPAIDYIISKFSEEKKSIRNWLGFGLGDGSFEKDIIQGLEGEKIKLFGFDPYYFGDTNNGVTYFKEYNELRNSSWDIISTRWCLHHIAPSNDKSRWKPLFQHLDHMSPGATLLIKEEGLHLDNYQGETKVICEFLMASWDLFITQSLIPSWSSHSAIESGQYYLRYLTKSDIAEIESHLKQRSDIRTYIEILDFGFNQQYLIFIEKIK